MQQENSIGLPPAEEPVIITKAYCFFNETSVANEPGKKDILELRLEISENIVEGYYNWLPTYKDQRKGSIQGILNDTIITGKYIFVQEGLTDTAKVKIILREKEAVISSPIKQLGIDAVIIRTDCR
ncbi:hypothetical protein L1I30_08220 [Gillisia sp. M10.2A]|uniref:Uncharacterized protein n=1 Tax=Gillisia lutea TaxID=2909668 RepID=A0ABS9EH69_9FLAO|nr:hypothetical protein [Gillisia lutea]MCF4101647.1 hypothetical protein [Gillisia lutea]